MFNQLYTSPRVRLCNIKMFHQLYTSPRVRWLGIKMLNQLHFYPTVRMVNIELFNQQLLLLLSDFFIMIFFLELLLGLKALSTAPSL